MLGFLLGVAVAVIVYLVMERKQRSGRTVEPLQAPPSPIIPDEKQYTDEFLESINEFDDTFGYGEAIIELENYGYTTSHDEWEEAMAKNNPPILCRYVLEKKSFALHESIIVAGKVFVMREPVMFSTMTDVMIYVEKLFVLYQIYEGVSPIDGKTVRFFVRGAMEEDGKVPVYGSNS